MKKINLPLTFETLSSLKAGDKVLLSGTLLTARDAAHKKIVQALNENKLLGFNIKNETIFYVGPSFSSAGSITAAGPTTSARMDAYAPLLLDKGLKGMIGKGSRSKDVQNSIKQNKGIYFCAIGGCGALYGSKIKHAEVVAFPELLSEAVYKIEIEDFPCVVGIDCLGNSVFDK
jgi:fumarate hydratase subunit beta